MHCIQSAPAGRSVLFWHVCRRSTSDTILSNIGSDLAQVTAKLRAYFRVSTQSIHSVPASDQVNIAEWLLCRFLTVTASKRVSPGSVQPGYHRGHDCRAADRRLQAIVLLYGTHFDALEREHLPARLI
jgi:hypothetical protein